MRLTEASTLVRWWMIVVIMANLALGYDIRLPEDPKLWEQTAAEELRIYLPKTVREFSLGGEILAAIHVGDTELAAELGLRTDELPAEKWVIKSVGNDLVLIGGGSRGTLYATYKFLEEVIGCRFFTLGEEYVPEARDFAFKTLALAGKPFFAHRCLYYYRLPRNSGRYLACRLLNKMRIELAYGGEVNAEPSWMHNMVSFYMPEATYFAEHPEYYALHKGERNPMQLCLSNREMRQEFIRNVKALVEKTNERTQSKGLPKVTHYNIAQEDGGAACSCADCTAFAAQHRHSGLLVDFLNEISAELIKIDPELVIDTYAYVYSSKPPTNGIKAAENIIFRVCNTHGSNHLTGESVNFPAMLEGWAKVASRLGVHEYGQLFSFLPEYPWANEFSFPVVSRLWAENGVQAVYNELSSDWYADFTVLKFYLFSKYLEDPYRIDFEALMADFCDRYFGAAGSEMLTYRKTLKRLSDRAGSKISWMCSAAPGHARYLDIDAIVSLQALFDTAETKVADDPVRLARLGRARQGLDWTLGFYLFRHYERQWAQRHPDEAFPFDLCAVRQRGVANFKIDMRADERTEKRCSRALAILEHDPKVEPSPRFQNVPHVDLAAFEISGGLVIEDPDAETGFAVYGDDRIAAGIYSVMRTKNFFGMTFDDFSPEAIQGAGYHWYKIAAGRLTEEGTGCNLILSASWSVQTSLAHLDIDYEQPFEIWARFKVEGPSYGISNESGKDAFYLDRVVIHNKQSNLKL